MEEKIKDFVEQAIKCKAGIETVDGEYITFDYFKQLPAAGDIIYNDNKKFEVIRRTFDLRTRHSWDYGYEYDCMIIVREIKSEED